MAQTKDIFEEQLADNSGSKIVIRLNNKLCNHVRKCILIIHY